MPDRCDVLEKLNAHPLDARVRYVDETHTYFLDGDALPMSVSGLWARHFPHFDAEKCLDSYFAAWTVDPSSKYFTLIKYLRTVHKMDERAQREEIRKLWSASGDEASAEGTAMHHAIEWHLNQLEVEPEQRDSVEFQQFLRWRATFMASEGLEPYRTEWSIYDEEAQIAGQIDCLMKTRDGRYVMVDWKRCNPTPRRPNMPMDLLGPEQKAFKNECGTGPCAALPNTSYWHYVVQQRCYTYILESFYGIQVDSSWLVQLHPALTEAHCVEVPRIDDIIEEIFSARYEEVRAKRVKTEAAFESDGEDEQ